LVEISHPIEPQGEGKTQRQQSWMSNLDFYKMEGGIRASSNAETHGAARFTCQLWCRRFPGREQLQRIGAILLVLSCIVLLALALFLVQEARF
jgi:hypothetical protein